MSLLQGQGPGSPRGGQASIADLLTDNLLARAPLDDLINARGKLEAHLPPASLKHLDLERELVLQVLALQALQARTIADDSVAANQRAQVANSLSAALTNLVKVQQEVYSSERLKKMEALLIEHLQRLPKEVSAAFLADYEQALSRTFT